MPQGKVIAVKPLSGASELHFMETASYSYSSAAEQESAANIVFIGVCRGNAKHCDTRRVRSIVWYGDTTGRLRVGDYVDFDINPQRIKAINAAENVEKLGGIVNLPGGLLSKVALLASLLLIFAVVKDSRR